MDRAAFWAQLLVGWLPVGVLFAVMISSAHGGTVWQAAPLALRMVVAAAVLGIVVNRAAARFPWPIPMTARFVVLHLAAAPLFAVAWWMLNNVMESVLAGAIVIVVGPGIVPYLVMGVWLYVMIAGVAYAQRAAARGAELEALAARTQLDALRAQLHPHFLFNALNTVVQLIPSQPALASRAAIQLAEALRIATGERRDLVPLRDEWSFVERYLAIEALRHGDRLRVAASIDPPAADWLVPSFALQTLVENAIRHAVAPREASSVLRIAARIDGARLVIAVDDDGPGIDASAPTSGTGLRRLRERLAGLYGSAASLELGRGARLLLPRTRGQRDGE